MAARKVGTADGRSRRRMPVTLDDIEAARGRLRGAIVETDCDWSRTLSDILGCKLWLKFENLQFTASFKERGALNRLSALSAEERQAGVIAMSAGNHAQGVAYHAQPPVDPRHHRHAGEHADGEGREHAPARRRGDPDAARRWRRRPPSRTSTGASSGLTFIHPYDDPLVIAGQGTIALEMLGAAPEIDTLVVPIGGGGLISGMAIAAKALKPDIR